MRKGVFITLLFAVIIASYSLYLVYNRCTHTSEISSLLLDNIEALAADEDGTDNGEVEGGRIRCIGVGSMDCPVSHDKVKYIIEGYSF